MMRAYCWATGLIEFGEKVPGGALIIARGPDELLREVVSVNARRAHDFETLLVPGVPEALDQADGLHAVKLFRKRVEFSLKRRLAEQVPA